MSSSEVNWRIESTGAKLQCGLLTGTVVVDHSGASFIVDVWNGRRVEGLSLLRYCGKDSLNLVETYARGGDFVVTFAESGEHRLAPQLYWRAAFVEQFAASQLELVISVKTDLLDSKPVSRINALVHSGKAFHADSLATPEFQSLLLDPVCSGGGLTWPPAVVIDGSQSREHLFVFRSRERDLSFAQLVHPSDFVAAELSTDMQINYSLEATLFPERLEKGVIRRGRICGWFLPAENDLEVAVQLARQFVAEPLPLTT